MNVRKAKHGWILTAVFTVISLMYVYPIVLVFINSFKKKAYISKEPFALPADKMFVGLENYLRGIQQTDLIKAFGWSVFITVFSVAAIILFCSMCAWYISRVNTKVTRTIYVLCLFAMVVPFQMEMYTLSKIANMLHMGNPWGIIVIYLGFGAGLSVFMFTGFMKSIPLGYDRRVYAHSDIFPGGHAHLKTDLRDSCHSSGNVDLERLSSAVSCTGPEKIQDGSHGHTVSERRLRFC